MKRINNNNNNNTNNNNIYIFGCNIIAKKLPKNKNLKTSDWTIDSAAIIEEIL